jgi:hypothetical protein
LDAKCPAVEPLEPLARKEGFDGGAGRLEEEPGAWRVAIAVGKTKEGESLPAKLARRRQPRKEDFVWPGGGGGGGGTPFLCILCHCR